MEFVAGLRDEKVEFWLWFLRWVWAGDLSLGMGKPSQNREETAGLKWVEGEIKR